MKTKFDGLLYKSYWQKRSYSGLDQNEHNEACAHFRFNSIVSAWISSIVYHDVEANLFCNLKSDTSSLNPGILDWCTLRAFMYCLHFFFLQWKIQIRLFKVPLPIKHLLLLDLLKYQRFEFSPVCMCVDLQRVSTSAHVSFSCKKVFFFPPFRLILL